MLLPSSCGGFRAQGDTENLIAGILPQSTMQLLLHLTGRSLRRLLLERGIESRGCLGTCAGAVAVSRSFKPEQHAGDLWISPQCMPYKKRQLTCTYLSFVSQASEATGHQSPASVAAN